jgi:hypothetical protein
MPAKRRKRTRKTRGGSVTPAKRTLTPAKVPTRPKRAKKGPKAPKRKPAKVPAKAPKRPKVKPAKAPKRKPAKVPAKAPKRPKVKPAKAPKRKPAKVPAKAPKRPKVKPAKAPKRKPAKVPKRPAKAPKRAPAKGPKRKPAKAPKRPPSERSQAAHKGWLKRRKRKRLLDAMADLEMKRADEDLADNVQPIGWTQHRQDVREFDGQHWHKIAVEFSETEFQARRLAILEDLEIDLLTRGELYDYLSWAGEHFDVEISDMYRMYLGYPVGEAAAEPG